MTKHTQGYWVYDYAEGYCGEIVAANGKVVCTFTDEPNKADAKLIADAPELFEVLEEMVLIFTPAAKDCTAANLIDKATSLIAKHKEQA